MWTSDIYDACTGLNRHLCRWLSMKGICVSVIQNAVYLEASGGGLSEMTPGEITQSYHQVYVHLSLDSSASIRRDIHE